MLVKGYKAGADFAQAAKSISKHTELKASDVKIICDEIRNGKAVNLPDDFCLREDMEDHGFFV